MNNNNKETANYFLFNTRSLKFFCIRTVGEVNFVPSIRILEPKMDVLIMRRDNCRL